MTRPAKRQQKYRIERATLDQEDSRWQCDTCSRPIEHLDARYCMHCRMYWNDVSNGLFDFQSPALARNSGGDQA